MRNQGWTLHSMDHWWSIALHRAMCCVAALTLAPAPALAQIPDVPVNITAFASLAAAGVHPPIGFALGLKPGPTQVSLEFEYSRSRRDPVAGVPAIRTVSGNIQVAAGPLRSRYQVYGTCGIGLYLVRHGRQGSEPSEAWNIGAGVKVALVGPLKLRMDYRAFFLAPIPGEYHSNVHRFYGAIVAGF